MSMLLLRIIGGIGLSTVVIDTTKPDASMSQMLAMLALVFVCGAVAIGHLMPEERKP